MSPIVFKSQPAPNKVNSGDIKMMPTLELERTLFIPWGRKVPIQSIITTMLGEAPLFHKNNKGSIPVYSADSEGLVCMCGCVSTYLNKKKKRTMAMLNYMLSRVMIPNNLQSILRSELRNLLCYGNTIDLGWSHWLWTKQLEPRWRWSWIQETSISRWKESRLKSGDSFKAQMFTGLD